MKHYILKMEKAKDGLGIVTANRYATIDGKEKRWSAKIEFEGTFEECLVEKRKMINRSK